MQRGPNCGSDDEAAPFIADPVHELVAERLVLVDSHARIRADLRLMSDGEPAISFYDRHGRERIRLGLRKQWLDEHHAEPPGTEVILQMTSDDNEGHGSSARITAGATAAAIALQFDRNDPLESPRAFIEVLEDEAIVVAKPVKG